MAFALTISAAEETASAGCGRCDTLDPSLPENGMLYLAPPLSHTLSNVRRYLHRAGIPYTQPDTRVVAVALDAPTLCRFCEDIGSLLTPAELQDTRALLIADGDAFSLSHLAEMQPLSTLTARGQGQWLLDLLRAERLVVHFQPIVAAAEPTRVFAYECLLRGQSEEGTLIYPNRLFSAALSADLLFQLDKAARLAAVRAAFENGLKERLFINFNPSAIYDPVFCLQTTTRAIADAGLSPEQVVFEVVESSQAQDEQHLLRILDFYRSRGFQVALDDFGAGYSSLNLLSKLRPDFMKLDMELTRGVDQDPYKAHIAAKLLELARGLGIRTIAEGIETEGEWRWAREQGADYMQGYLFARPAAPAPLPCFPGSR